jgi:hypothetical protein
MTEDAATPAGPNKNKRRRIVKVVGLLAVVLLASIWLLWQSLFSVPSFYVQAASRPIARQSDDRRGFVRQTAELSNSWRREGEWRVEFREEQLNAWLAVDLPENHPELLSPEYREPRIDLVTGGFILACETVATIRPAVVSLSLVVESRGDNLVRLQIQRARIGLLPLPMKGLLEGVTEFARESNLRLHWESDGSTPTAIVDFSALAEDGEYSVTLEQVEFREDLLVLSGRTERSAADDSSSAHSGE